MRARHLLILTAAAVLLLPTVRTHGQEKPGPVVAAVDFIGRRHVPEEVLRQATTLKPGEPFSAARLEADRKALLSLGYFRGVGAAQRTGEGGARVTFRLVEWPRVAHIRVLGNSVVETAAILEALRTRVGQVLCAPQLQGDIRSIEQLYRGRGYVAHVSERLLDEAARSGILRFEILEVGIGEVRFEGGSLALRERARTAVAEVPPALYRPEAVAEDQLRLLQIPGVRSAQPLVDPINPSRVRIRWRLNGGEGPASSTGAAAPRGGPVLPA